MRSIQRDRLLAVLVAVFAASYIAAARSIEDSLLADAVGAGGVPQGVGLAMLCAALALLAKTWLGPDPGAALRAGQAALAPARRAGALLLILLAYGVLLPWAGYTVAVSLLILAAGRLAGAAFGLPLLLSAACGGALLWALFDRLLQVRMPLGSLWS